MSYIILENTYDHDTYKKFHQILKDSPFKYFWRDIVGSYYWNQSNPETRLNSLIEEMWVQFSNKFSDSGKRGNTYINAQTFGLEPGAHFDTEEDNGVTVINFITDTWNITWGGETILYNFYYDDLGNDEHIPNHFNKPITVDTTVIPAYNKTLVFPSNQLHMVKPMSRFYNGIRYTLMYKITGITFEQLKKNYNEH